VKREARVYEFTGFIGAGEGEPYKYLPFEVPEGCVKIQVEYGYEPSDECVLDIGVFQPGEIGFLKAAESFRGWSGSNKKSFYLSPRNATPGYLPGPIKAGTWKIILGLYRIPEKGCRYRVKIKLLLAKAEAKDGYRKSNIERVGEGEAKRAASAWLKGDLHVHSVHSDGDASVGEIARRARQLGLDFVAITDHNTVSQLRDFSHTAGVLLIPGEEVTTYYGHMNVLGVKEWVDFRITSERQARMLIEHVKGRGYLPVINHPKPLGPEWRLGNVELAGYVEVWQGVWEFNNYVSLKLVDDLLLRGSWVGMVGGSDAHKVRREEEAGIFRLGHPTTWVNVEERSVRGVLEGIRKGRVIVTENPSGPFLTLKAPKPGSLKVYVKAQGAEGLVLRLVSQGELVEKDVIDSRRFFKVYRLRLPRDGGYIRAELVDPEGLVDELHHPDVIVKALTSPLRITDSCK